MREIHDELGKDNGYTTTLKQMQVMTEKELLIRSKRFGSHVYEASVPKEQTQQQIAGDLLKRAFGGSARSLVLGALSAQPASHEELADIRGMLDTFARLGFGMGPVNLMYAETAVIVGIIAINLPFTVLTLQSVFEGIDPRLEEAAASMGAAPSRAFWRVVFPLALPGITIAAVLCFILCMNAFATPLLLGGPRFHMMAPLLFWAFSSDNNWPFAAASAFILMGTTLGLTGLAGRVVPRRLRG